MNRRVLALLLMAGLPCVSLATSGPNFHGCLGATARARRYCDFSLSYDQRVDALLDELTLDEQISMIGPNRSLGDPCAGHMGSVERLGLPGWTWLTETNSQVSAGCFRDGICPTTFVGNLGMSASFNRSSWHLKGLVMGYEMRAFNNLGWHRGHAGDQVTLTGFGPNINIARDPRFGRTSEIAGEDPFLSGTFAANVVAGMQTPDDQGRPLMLAFLKHFTAYSRETDRGHDTYAISKHDLFETYLAQYKIAFSQGNASAAGVMCSYDAENGNPSCANTYLLNDILRSRWGRKDALVVTDCNAVPNLRGAPVHAADDTMAAAMALNNGTDVELGSTLFISNLRAAVNSNLTTAATVRIAARRALKSHFRAGRFDLMDAEYSYSRLGVANINTTAHQAISLEAALQSLVLLKNDGTLPLKVGLRLAVLGPQGVTVAGLLPDYAGNDKNANTCMTGGVPSNDCMTTIADALASMNHGGKTSSAAGVEVNSAKTSGIASALTLGRAADAVVLVLGIDKTVEQEGTDRTDTALPGLQESFAQQVLSLGKPTVLVLVNGGQLAIDSLVKGPVAIVEAFNPAVMGPRAIALSLFGHSNRWGRLPYTLYPHSFIDQQPMDNFDMAKAPGRTYKYYQGQSLFEFGFGLSYTSFDVQCKWQQGDLHFVPTAVGPVECGVQNTGAWSGDEVLLVYHAAGSDVRARAAHPVPFRQLRAFDRVSLEPGTSAKIVFDMSNDDLRLVDANGHEQLYSGSHSLIFTGVGNRIVAALNVTVHAQPQSQVEFSI